MNKCKRKICWILLLSLCRYAAPETTSTQAPTEVKEELSVAEAKDRLDIVKTIKKINKDGSYTIGYEADDGSFKIESRDVLGNIKGTYGYVDDGGEIKRVSYSTKNFSDIISEAPSVVQRIPKTNDMASTKSPSILVYNPSTVSTTTKRTITTASPTTVSGPTRFIHFPQRSLLKTTPPAQADLQKSEGQIIRPEVSTVLPVDIHASKRNVQHKNLNEKPVTEEPEIKESNLLRRQLPQEFNARQHVEHLQQGLGDDTVDVYTGSHTSRPLFTTTNRPAVFSTPHLNLKTNKPQITTETAIKENVISEATSPEPAPAAVYQVQQQPPPFVVVRHPYHGGVVLMPYSQVSTQPQYFAPNPQYLKQVAPVPTQYPENPETAAPVYIQRPPLSRSVPLQINENAYLQPTSEPVHHLHTAPRGNIGEIAHEVDGIRPPVSVKDFQKIIELLILRQARLEHANSLLFAHLANRATPSPGLFVRRPVSIAPQHLEQSRYIIRPSQENDHQDHAIEYSTASSSYTPTRRVARLLRSESPSDDQNEDEDYLPPQIREMLLLRMLQLAINPALPIRSSTREDQDASTPQPHYVKKEGVRNVEVLGEEDESNEGEFRSPSSSSYKQYRKRYL